MFSVHGIGEITAARSVVGGEASRIRLRLTGPAMPRARQGRLKRVLVPDADQAAVFADPIEMDGLDDRAGYPPWFRPSHFASCLRALRYRLWASAAMASPSSTSGR